MRLVYLCTFIFMHVLTFIQSHMGVFCVEVLRCTRRHTYTHTHVQTRTSRHTDTDTQTHRHTDTQTHRHTDTQEHRHTKAQTQGQMNTQIHRHKDEQTMICRRTCRITHKHTHTHTHTGTDIHRHLHAHTHTNTHIHTHTYIHIHVKREGARARETQTQIRKHTNMYMYTQRHSLSHTQTHTHHSHERKCLKRRKTNSALRLKRFFSNPTDVTKVSAELLFQSVFSRINPLFQYSLKAFSSLQKNSILFFSEKWGCFAEGYPSYRLFINHPKRKPPGGVGFPTIEVTVTGCQVSSCQVTPQKHQLFQELHNSVLCFCGRVQGRHGNGKKMPKLQTFGLFTKIISLQCLFKRYQEKHLCQNMLFGGESATVHVLKMWQCSIFVGKMTAWQISQGQTCDRVLCLRLPL